MSGIIDKLTCENFNFLARFFFDEKGFKNTGIKGKQNRRA